MQGPPPILQVRKPARSGRLVGSGVRSSAEPSKTDVVSTAATISPRLSRTANAIPDSLLQDAALNADIELLPSNYSFEVHKTVHRVRTLGARRVALQMPEGLLLYASVLADILRAHCDAETLVLGDVTYGACCVDDLSAVALGADLLVHYGHSCLVPVQGCALPMLYVFVHIAFDPSHLLRCLADQFPRCSRIALVGTIQFVDTLHAIRNDVAALFRGPDDVIIPQARPLSPGELLGCTSPRFPDCVDSLVYVGDGRFHLESAMIANPTLPAYRYDPYSKVFTREEYEHATMLGQRRSAIAVASTATRIGIIMGTLGRQGSPKILERVRDAVRAAGRSAVIVLLSEITPHKVQRMEASYAIDAWVQIACPRLSIDWGEGYGEKPLLTPYELFVAVGATEWREQYPMDFYAKDGGEWTNYYKPRRVVENGANEACAAGDGAARHPGDTSS
jgi:2-(3-amino-3-carboxypropyl)histidine synthase